MPRGDEQTPAEPESLPELPVLSQAEIDAALPELPVLHGDPAADRAGTIRALLASLSATHADDSHEPATLQKKYRPPPWWRRAARQLRARGPGWAASAAAHAAALFLMAQIVMIIRDPDGIRAILITLSDHQAEEAGQSAAPDEHGTDEAPEPAPAEEPEETPGEESDAPAAQPPAAPEPEPNAARPDELEEPPGPPAPDDAATPAEAIAPKAWHNRTGPGKSQALNKYGGSAETEAAVERGLRWLAEHQNPDGRWSGLHFPDRCPKPGGRWAGRTTNGRVINTAACNGTGNGAYDVAHTGLAALCYLGAGHLPGTQRYGPQVSKALVWLRRAQRHDGGFDVPGSHACMYNHGIATLALCEAAALTGDAEIKTAAQRAINYLCAAQTTSGGWDYTGAGSGSRRSDTSITGWAVMAMKSALVANLQVPRSTWDKTWKYIRNAQRKDGEYAYDDSKTRFGPAMTAAGLTCDLYLSGEDPVLWQDRAVRRIASEPPDWDKLHGEQYHTIYYWYYGTLALFQTGGEPWREWNTAMRTTLLRNQRRDGHAAGSWDPAGRWLGSYGGRVYATTLNILCLEIYYRYLPVYRGLGTQPTEDAVVETPWRESLKPRVSRNADAYRVDNAEDALEKVTADAPAMRLAAVDELAKAEGAKAFQALKRRLTDRNQMVRFAAVRALTTRPEPDATQALLAAFAAESRDLRRVLVRALGKRGDEAAVPALIGALGDRDSGLHRPAVRALEQITQQRLGTSPRAWKNWWQGRQRK